MRNMILVLSEVLVVAPSISKCPLCVHLPQTLCGWEVGFPETSWLVMACPSSEGFS
jgi:hypothetical protein